MNPRFPIYIPSKGRWESRLTIKALDKCRVPYRVVIEEQEYEHYRKVVDPSSLIILPFSNRGLAATRTWIKHHSIAEGHEWHWQLDDNILSFVRLHLNRKIPMETGTNFYVIEDLVTRYENVAQAGMQYFMFAPRKNKAPVLRLNTRIYSCTLTNNAIPFEWRSFYNDDTDMSLQCLKAGWCTILCQTFLAWKMPTMQVKGGMTPHYQGNGRLDMARALVDLHPDVTTVKWKFHRWQHQVDYRKFKANRLKLKPGVTISPEINNYGMEIQWNGERT
jgi:hypothetical protein